MEEKIYKEIQNILFFMIPEDWEKIVLYASVVNEDIPGRKGEMYFYYVPKNILERQPVNSYEIPNIFDIDEFEYLNLINNLYNKIIELKKKRRIYRNSEFTYICITIKDNIFKIEYFYNDIERSKYNSYQRHLIFRAKYLGLEPLKKEEKQIVEEYAQNLKYLRIKKEVYSFPIKINQMKNIIDYEKVLTIDEAILRKNDK